ncbi:ABC transporter ATP-binding protein [Flavimobilis marinus]|uniref:ABC transporter ATP-binding protein n=1 Tax=Flavimobilis marinus TaxID=285351 RepID=UPI0035711A87
MRTLAGRRTTKVRAVDDVSFEIPRGAIVGFLGPNGAGKSTTIKMMTGIIRPDTGDVSVLGVDPARQRIRNAQQIGVVFGQRSQLSWDVPVRESLRLVASIYGVTRADTESVIASAAAELELGPLLAKPTRQLSLGQKMRCEIAAALIHRPPVVYLDEPTIGLDVQVKELIRGYLQRINREFGTTIVLTTHDMGDVEALCQSVLVIDAGRVVFDGAIHDLKDTVEPRRTVIFRRSSGWSEGIVEELNAVLPDGARVEEAQDAVLTVVLDPLTTTSGRVVSAVASRYESDEVSVHEPTIEAVVRQIYAGALA